MPTNDDDKTGALGALGPKDHAEAVALFRAQVIGPLCARNLDGHGELSAALRALSTERFAAPGDNRSRSYAHATLERWYYRYRALGLSGLRPRRRSDRGHARALSAEQRALLLDIRREYPTANASLIVRTLEADGRLARGTMSVSTLRRLYAEQGLDRASLGQGSGGGHVRLRWQAEHVNALWHADVCHGPALRIAGRVVPLRIHALLDDHSRYIVAIQACATERESEMLALVVKALRLQHPPSTLYLDNGATYSGAVLSTACGRLGVSLVHAKPYDPQARGKMERFWRTLREGCLDHLGAMQSLQDVQVRLLAFVDEHYHQSAHASLLGRTPAQVYAEGRSKDASSLDEAKLCEALTVRAKRRVRRDGTVDIGGVSFETTAGFLAGRVVQVARSLLDVQSAPWIEHEEQRIELRVVDAVKNARRHRAERSHHAPRGIDVSFDPAGVLVDKMLGRIGKSNGGAS